MVLTVSFVISPGTGSLAPVIGAMRKHHRQLDASIGAFVKGAAASTASRPAFVTTAKRPSDRNGTRWI
jgi:hypothetical protein